MSRVLTPMQLDQLLHYYYSAEPYPSSEAADANIQDLIEHGLILPYSGSVAYLYHVTKRGEAYVNTMLELPLPVQVWVTPTKTD